MKANTYKILEKSGKGKWKTERIHLISSGRHAT